MAARFSLHQVPRSAYQAFARYHYRSAKLGPTDSLWVIRDQGTRRDLGIVVYAHAGLAARPRRRALPKALWGGPLAQRADAINANLRVLQRLVVLPEARGRGLGVELVRRTLPLLAMPMVEAFAKDGRVLERAGMTLFESSQEPASPISRLRAFLKEANKERLDFQSLSQRIDARGYWPEETRQRFWKLSARAFRDFCQSHGSHLRQARKACAQHLNTFWSTILTPTRYFLWHADAFTRLGLEPQALPCR